MSILKTETGGKTGIKRTTGFILVIISILLALVDQFTSYKVNETIWLTMFGSGVTLIGITAIPKIK